MKSIQNRGCEIVFNNECYSALNQYIKAGKFSNIFVLVDYNTHEFCLPYLLSNIENRSSIKSIIITAGEEHKNIETCSYVWSQLSQLDADRKSLLINLGGGVLTDLGGFVACTFKRGIKYVNIPTTLLSMVDASVGGKTGVDLGALKNQIGIINNGDLVLIDTYYFNTLPEIEFRSGIAEMLKHGLICSKDYWKKMVSYLIHKENIDQLIYESVKIKTSVVNQDPNEMGLRKILNFGHTLGHAIESYYLESEEKIKLLHGEAIAIGMILEVYLSFKIFNFSKHELYEIKRVFLEYYPKVSFNKKDLDAILELLKYDKKNDHGNINFVLLEAIGKPKIDCKVDNRLIHEAFDFYSK